MQCVTDAFVCCTASRQLTLAVSDLLAVQPQLASSKLSQSKLHIRVRKACRIRLVEYFQILAPSDLETDDVGKLPGSFAISISMRFVLLLLLTC